MASVKPGGTPLPPDDSRGTTVLAVSWAFIALSIVFVGLRLWARSLPRRTIGWDDYTIAFAVAAAIVTQFLFRNGIGRHVQYLQPLQLQTVVKFGSLVVMLHTLGIFFVRVSVCLFVLRLVPRRNGRFHRWTWWLMIFFALVTLSTFLTQCFQCIPLQAVWDRSIKGRCISLKNYSIVNRLQGSFATLMDLLCVFLPIFYLWNLNAKTPNLIALFSIIGLGVLTAAAALARTVLINFTSTDPTWDVAPVAIWAIIEQDLGIIVASIPALRQLIAIFQEKYSTPSLIERSFRSDRKLESSPPKPNSFDIQYNPRGRLDNSTFQKPQNHSVESSVPDSRRPSMMPRSAGLGLPGRESEEKLERDLIHHEDEKLSPRETPWATPRVSPRFGSFGSASGPDQRSYSCTMHGGLRG